MAGKPRDRVGQVYSDGETSITITSISDRRGKSGEAYWNGQCSCGKMRYEIAGSHLFHGFRKSRKSVCSCLDCANKKKSDIAIDNNQKSEEKRREDANMRREVLRGAVPEEWFELPLTRTEANQLGVAQYFSAEPCSAGHQVPRQSDGSCMECKRLDMARRRATPEGKAKVREYSKRRWADPEVRAKAQAQRAAWAKTEQGRASLRKSFRSFYTEHRDRLMTEHAAYLRRRTKSDPAFRLRRNLASRIYQALKNQKTTKDSTTMKLVGCDLQSFVEFIEAQFEEWMSWENMGDWHVDHVRPCASFDLSVPEQQSVCFNWRNLQPLDGDENYEKRDGYTPADEEAWIERMQALGYEGELFLRYEET